MVLEVVEREANGTVLRPLGVEAGVKHGNHGVLRGCRASLRIAFGILSGKHGRSEVLFRTVVGLPPTAVSSSHLFCSTFVWRWRWGGCACRCGAWQQPELWASNAMLCGEGRSPNRRRQLFPPAHGHAGTVEDILPLQLLRQQQSNERGETGTDLAGEDTDARRPIVAVLDPPRTGLAPSVCKLLRAQTDVSKIVFVSCNPHGHTLRRDYVVKGGSLGNNLRILCGPRGHGRPFRIEKVVPVDLFVHTPHVELVVLAVRT